MMQQQQMHHAYKSKKTEEVKSKFTNAKDEVDDKQAIKEEIPEEVENMSPAPSKKPNPDALAGSGDAAAVSAESQCRHSDEDDEHSTEVVKPGLLVAVAVELQLARASRGAARSSSVMGLGGLPMMVVVVVVAAAAAAALVAVVLVVVLVAASSAEAVETVNAV